MEGSGTFVFAEISGTTISIPQNIVNGDTIQGTGTYNSNNTLGFNYSFRDVKQLITELRPLINDFFLSHHKLHLFKIISFDQSIFTFQENFPIVINGRNFRSELFGFVFIFMKFSEAVKPCNVIFVDLVDMSRFQLEIAPLQRIA